MRGVSGYLLNYPGLHQTNLGGSWDFDVRWTPRILGHPTPTGPDTITIFDAFEKQLGLKLSLIAAAAPVIAIDGANERPTANAPEVSQKPPAPAMEFEVAEIKPEDPDSDIKGSSVGIERGGRVRVDMTLKGLIHEAWGDLNPDLIVGGPKSMDATRFEVIAAVFNGIDIDSMRTMLRALLVAAKAKLRKADPANHPGCRQGPGPDGKDPRIANPMLSSLVTCLNMTVAQFAAQLSAIGWGYIHEFPRVVDATGIEGRYDFTISFSLPSAWRKIPVAPAADGMAADPDGAVSIFDAVDKQLGLRLEGRRVPAQVLVIDRVDGAPSENLGGLCTRLPPRGAYLQSACRLTICPALRQAATRMGSGPWKTGDRVARPIHNRPADSQSAPQASRNRITGDSRT